AVRRPLPRLTEIAGDGAVGALHVARLQRQQRALDVLADAVERHAAQRAVERRDVGMRTVFDDAAALCLLRRIDGFYEHALVLLGGVLAGRALAAARREEARGEGRCARCNQGMAAANALRQRRGPVVVRHWRLPSRLDAVTCRSLDVAADPTTDG